MEQEKVIMSDLKSLLTQRLLSAEVNDFSQPHIEIPLLELRLTGQRNATFICTNGLSDKKMNVPEHLDEPNRVELLWCLPDYWDLSATQNPSMQWIFPWTTKLTQHLLSNDTWYGHGHTFPTGQLSPTMKQDFLMLMYPQRYLNEFATLEVGDKKVHFLAIVPLFKREFEFKQRKGTQSMLNRMEEAGVTEMLDDYRESLLKRKFGLF